MFANEDRRKAICLVIRTLRLRLVFAASNLDLVNARHRTVGVRRWLRRTPWILLPAVRPMPVWPLLRKPTPRLSDSASALVWPGLQKRTMDAIFYLLRMDDISRRSTARKYWMVSTKDEGDTKQSQIITGICSFQSITNDDYFNHDDPMVFIYDSPTIDCR